MNNAKKTTVLRTSSQLCSLGETLVPILSRQTLKLGSVEYVRSTFLMQLSKNCHRLIFGSSASRSTPAIGCSCNDSDVYQWNKVVITCYNCVFLIYNWLLKWVTKLLRQILFNLTMILRALVLKMESFSRTHSRATTVTVSLHKLG